MTYRDGDSVHPAIKHYPDLTTYKTAAEAYVELWKKHSWPGRDVKPHESRYARKKRIQREQAALDPTEVQRRKSLEGQEKRLKRRIIVYNRDKWTCVECGTHITNLPQGVHLTLDHIRPTSKGGSNFIDNLQTMCSTCNEAKDNTWDGVSGSGS